MFKTNSIKILFSAIFISLIFSFQSVAVQWDSPVGQFVTDQSNRVDRLEHPAVDTFSMIDFFMCLMNVGSSIYPNKNYKAQVDEGKCQALTGQSSPSEQTTAYANSALACTRDDNTSPQTCRAWYEAADGARYLVLVSAITGPTTERPNGEFTFHFCKANSDGICPTSPENGYGMLSVRVIVDNGVPKTRFQLIDIYEDGGETYTERLTAVSTDHKLATMTGATQSYNYSTGTGVLKRYEFDFDGTYVFIQEGSEAAACHLYDDFTEYPRSYSLYSMTDGSLKTGAGGFPFEVTSSSTATVGSSGYWNYWGAHVHDRDAATGFQRYLSDGDTVTSKVTNAELGITAGLALTAEIAGGNLRERSPFTGTLSSKDQNYGSTSITKYLFHSDNGSYGEIPIFINLENRTAIYASEDCANDPSNTFTTNGSGRTNANSNAISCDVTSLLTWDGASNINVTGTYPNHNTNFDANSDIVGGWFTFTAVSGSNQLTGALTSKTSINARPELNNSSSGGHNFANDLYLKCYGSHCAFPTTDGTSLSTTGYSYDQFVNRVVGDAQGVRTGSNTDLYIGPSSDADSTRQGTDDDDLVYFKFERDNMTLYRCSGFDIATSTCTNEATQLYPVICDPADASCLTPDYSAERRMWQGNLVPFDETIATWGDMETATTYSWNTSNHARNDKGAYAVDSTNDFVNIERPLEFRYQHTSDNYRNATDTAPDSDYFSIKYEGPGELHGWHWTQQNIDGDWDYYPEITIADGTTVDTDSVAGDDHAILATQVKLLPPTAVASSICLDRGLTVTADATTLPTMTGENDINTLITHNFTQLTDGTYTFVSDSPCMIEGVRQEVIEDGVDVCAP